jgi:hypothetical protein
VLVAGGFRQVVVQFKAAVDDCAQRRRQLVERRVIDLPPDRPRQQQRVSGQLLLHLLQPGPQPFTFQPWRDLRRGRAMFLPVPASQRRSRDAGLACRAGDVAIAGDQCRQPALAFSGAVNSAHANPSLIMCLIDSQVSTHVLYWGSRMVGHTVRVLLSANRGSMCFVLLHCRETVSILNSAGYN